MLSLLNGTDLKFLEQIEVCPDGFTMFLSSCDECAPIHAPFEYVLTACTVHRAANPVVQNAWVDKMSKMLGKDMPCVAFTPLR